MFRVKNSIAELFAYQRENQRSLDEINWAAIFNASIADSTWFVKQSVNPGRWALGFPALYVLFRVLNDVKPKSILEFGLGESTKLTYQYATTYPDVHLRVIEHDPNWASIFNRNAFDASDHIKLVELEQNLEDDGAMITTYKNVLEQVKDRTYDFVLVDGPFGSPRQSRAQIVDIIRNDLLSEQFIVVVDDAERKGEKDTIEKCEQLFKDRGVKFYKAVYSGKKDTCVFCSEQYKFISSL